MANGEQSNRKSGRKSAKNRKRRAATVTGNTPTRDGTPARERTNTLQRLDKPEGGGGGMERVPSNAPTMAIAPSDYEHIFHEATGNPAGTGEQRSPPAPRVNMSPAPAHSPPAMPPIVVAPPALMRSPEAADYPQAPYPVAPPPPPPTYDLAVTPDGYTLLGHEPDTRAGRRQPLPPHVVRASNQFSRAALARVARYLASRAEPTR